MSSTEQRRISIETFIRFDHGYADTIAELGYPTRHSLRAWHKDYLEHGEVRPPKRRREPKFTLEMRQAAVDYCLAHGKSLARTMRRMGHPASREHLCGWIDELAPGRGNTGGRARKRALSRSRRGCRRWPGPGPAAEPLRRSPRSTARSRAAPCVWRREMMGDDGGEPETRGGPVGEEFDDLPDGIEVLRDMLREAKMRLRKVQLGLEVRQATLEMVKKDPGAEPGLLTNEEKAAMVEALGAEYRLCEIPPVAGMAKSSCEYARSARAGGEAEGRAAARKAVIEAFEAGGGTYGYGRVHAQASADAGDGAAIGEWTVRSIMEEENLVARAARKRRRYSSYEGEISEAPTNLLRDDRGKHHFLCFVK